MSIDVKDTIKACKAYVTVYRCRMYVNNMDLDVFINRTDSLIEASTQLWNGAIYFKDPDQATAFRESLNKLEMVIPDKYTVSYIFDEPVHSEEIYFFKVELEESFYVELLGSAKFNGNIHINFIPTAWEVQNLKGEYLNNKGAKWTRPDEAKVMKIRETAARLMVYITGRYRQVSSEKVENLTVYTESIRSRGMITPAEMKIWLENRHEFFMNLFLAHNNLESSASNVRIKDKVKTRFETNKTPDYYFKDGNTHMFLEFAVTDADWVEVYNNKMDHYSDTFRLVNQMMVNPDEKAEIHPVILDKKEWTIRTTEKISNMFYTNIDFEPLKAMSDEVEGVSNYPVVKQIVDSMGKFENADELIRLEHNLAMEVMEPFSKKKKSISLEMARNPDFIGKELMDFKKYTITVDEDRIINELKKRRVNWMDNATTTVALANDRLTSAKFTFEIQRILTKTSSDNIKAIVKNKMKENLDLRKFLMREVRIPKVFKWPVVEDTCTPGPCPDFVNKDSSVLLNDNTILVKGKKQLDFLREPEHRAGIGMSHDDVEKIELFIKIHTEFADKGRTLAESFRTTNLYKYMKFYEKLSREVMLMSERRFATTRKPVYHCYKELDTFTLFMHKGPKISDERSVFIKLIVRNEDEIPAMGPFFRDFNRKGSTMFYETNWVAVTSSDLEHYATISSRALAIIEDYETKLHENRELLSKIRGMPYLANLISWPLITMMEHKRPTSTALQLNRYLMHGMTSEICDVAELTEEIFDNPIRTVVQSAVVQKQAAWMIHMAEQKNYSLVRDLQHNLVERDFDRFNVPSFFTLEKIEFHLVMNEIYLSNLLNKSIGFRSHREKEIMNKMAKEEKHYEEIMMKEIGSMTFLESEKKSSHHEYSSDFLRSAVQYYRQNKLNDTLLTKAITATVTRTIDEVIKMTKSVVSVPDLFWKGRLTADRVKKDFVFSAVVEELKKKPTNFLMEIIRNDTVMYAVFSTFSKDQIGSVREILIQMITTRMHTKFFNNFFEELCKFHEKEMITSEEKKRAIQSDQSTIMREEHLRSLAPDSKHLSIPASLNMDSSKWAPSMVMETYMEEILEMKLPLWLEDELLSTVRAFACKGVYAPNSVIQKWKIKPEEEAEADPDTQWVRSRMSETGLIWFRSGMGQGNLHHPSSWHHVVVDDYADFLIRNIMTHFGVKNIKSTSLISSDDCTKMVTLVVDKEKKQYIPVMMVMYIDLLNRFRKMSNIHINWKKSAMQTMITEFNSMFSIGKRVCMASIKSIYNATNIPDMTYPDRAVKEVIGNIRRVLEDGCYISVYELLLKEMREQMKTWYNLKGERLEELKTLFRCEEKDLPFQLGFIPTDYPVETLIFGPEIHMFKKMENDSLQDFYNGLYSAERKVEDINAVEIDVEEAVSGKYIIELDSRLDTRIRETKREFYIDDDMSYHIKEAEKYCMDTETSLYDVTAFFRYINVYLLNVTRRYEFGVSYRLNSMIRAMQHSGTNIKIMSSGKELIKGNIREVCEFIMAADKSRTLIKMFDTFKMILAEAMEVESELRKMPRREKKLHPKFRNIKFYNTKFFRRAKEKEIIQEIFSKSPESKARVVEAVKELSELLGFSMENMIDDPFNCIKTAFSNTDRPYASFKEFISFYEKTLAYNSVNMVLDFVPRDTRKKNILGIYQYRSKPGFVYESTDSIMLEEEEKRFVNRMTLLGQDAAKDLVDSQEVLEKLNHANVKFSDTDILVAMKLLAKANEEFQIEMPMNNFPKVLYSNRSKEKTKSWTNFREMICLTQINDNAYYTSEYVFNKMDAKERDCVDHVLREIRVLKLTHPKLRVNGMLTMAEIEDNLYLRLAKEKISMNSTAKLSFNRNPTFTTVFLTLKSNRFKICRFDTTVYPDVEDEATDEMVMEMHNITSGDLNIEMFDNFVYKVIKEEFEVPEAKQQDEMTPEMIQKFMCNMVAGAGSVIGSVTRMAEKLTEEPEEGEVPEISMKGVMEKIMNDSDFIRLITKMNLDDDPCIEEEMKLEGSDIPLNKAVFAGALNIYDNLITVDMRYITSKVKDSTIACSIIFTDLKNVLDISDQTALSILSAIIHRNNLLLMAPKYDKIRNVSNLASYNTQFRGVVKNLYDGETNIEDEFDF